MAKTTAGARASGDPAQTVSPGSVDLGDVDVADPVDQQVAVPESMYDKVGAATENISEEEARKAAEWVRAKRYGPAMTTIIGYIAAHAMDTQDLNSVIMEQMALRILNAQSADEVLDPFGTMRGEDLYDKPLMITGVQYLISDIGGEGFPWYCAVEYDNGVGGKSVAIVGGEKLVPQLAGLDMHDGFPRLCRIHAGKTRAGNTILELQLPQGNDTVPRY